MRAFALALLCLALPAAAQEGGAALYPPPITPSTSATALKYVAQAGTGTSAFEMTQGARFNLDGATGSKYFSSNGTTLTLTGTSLTVATSGSTITGLTVPSYLESTGILYVRGQFNYITNDTSTYQLRLFDDDAVCVGNTTGTDCDGALQTGTLKVGLTGTLISASIRGTGTLDFASALVGACSADLTITATGATAGTEVSIGVPNASMAAGSQFQGWVSATDTVSVRHCCQAGTSCDPASGTFSARVFNP